MENSFGASKGLILKKVLWPRRREEERLVDRVVFAYLTKRDLSLQDFFEHGMGLQRKGEVLYLLYRKELVCRVDYLNKRVDAYEGDGGRDE
ncbi:MAG: hypothetical protein EA383_16705 [Spirochaetaceae bacterium]|nr:MAG: hypothetical protein EA383_16705 [Spirochaetaceae bacterium]